MRYKKDILPGPTKSDMAWERNRRANIRKGTEFVNSRARNSYLPPITTATVKKKTKPQSVDTEHKKAKLPFTDTKHKRNSKSSSRVKLVDCLKIEHLPTVTAMRGAGEHEVKKSQSYFHKKIPLNEPIPIWVTVKARKVMTELLGRKFLARPPILPQSGQSVLEMLQWDDRSRATERACIKLTGQNTSKPGRDSKLPFEKSDTRNKQFNKRFKNARIFGQKLERKFDFDEIVIAIIRNNNCLAQSIGEGETEYEYSGFEYNYDDSGHGKSALWRCE